MFKQRKIVIFAILSVFFVLLLGQLIHVQVIDHSYYLKRSQDTITEVEMLRPLRGGMTGRNGKVLARNLRQYNLFIIPGYVDDEEQLFKYISSLTGTPLRAITDRYEEILDKIDRYAEGGENKREKNRRRRSARRSPHRLLRYLTFEEASRIQTNRTKFKGTHIRSRPARRYPEEDVLGHVTGYVSKLSRDQKIQGSTEYAWMKEHYYHKYLGEHLTQNQLKRLEWRGSFLQGYIGRAGLEDRFDMELRGVPGLQLIERDLLSGSSDQHQHIAPENGTNLQLTIDTEWQKAASEVMSDINGALVAMDPETYEVRVMVSSPGFDPNRLVPPVSQQAVSDILQNSSRPLLNRTISGLYPPGSAFKTLVSIAGIESGTIAPSTSFNCTGTFQYGNHTWECWIYSKIQDGHGMLTVSEALEHSCNVFFYKTGKRLGASPLRQWAKRFGFSEKTGIELPSENRGSLFGNRDIINASIGQGSLQVTPLQMARLISFVAAGNPYQEPTLLKHPEPSQNPRKLPVSKRTLESIRKGMYDVVNSTEGTAYNPAPYLHSDELDYDIAGKTSTAQVGGDKKPHAWFVGFAPYDDPKLAFVVIYEHGNGGGLNAAPLMESFFKKIDLVNPDNDRSDESSTG